MSIRPTLSVIHLARKPLAGIVATNVSQFGSGALAIDLSRLGGGSTERPQNPQSTGPRMAGGNYWKGGVFGSKLGRFPVNVILEHSPGCSLTGTHFESFDIMHYDKSESGNFSFFKEDTKAASLLPGTSAGQLVEDWVCVEGCPCLDFDSQSGIIPAGKYPGRRGAGGCYGGAKGQEGLEDGETSAGGSSKYFKQVKSNE